MSELRQHFVGRGHLGMALADRLADRGSDEVEELPAAQRVVDDVRVMSRPQRGRRKAQLLRHVADVEHGAVAHVAAHRRHRVADDRLADHGLPAVGAHQRRAAQRLAARQLHPHRAVLDLEARHSGAGAQVDQCGERLATAEERPMDVGAVGDRIGVAEALGEALIERDVDHSFAAHAVEHQQALDEHRLLLHQLPDAERIERVPRVRRDLDAGADLAELRRLLEHHALVAFARQRQRCGKAADAAARDDYGLLVPRGGWRCHRVQLRNSRDPPACARCGMYRAPAAADARPAPHTAVVSRGGIQLP